MSAVNKEAKKLVKYGKSFKDIAGLKRDFFENNQGHLRRCLELNELYTKQPKREHCKVCATVLPKEVSLHKHGVAYTFCTVGGQRDGNHEATHAYCEAIYSDNSGLRYAEQYSSEDKEVYRERCNAIYLPKARFLAEVLANTGENIEDLRIVDVGAGSGYFLRALELIGVQDVSGFYVGA